MHQTVWEKMPKSRGKSLSLSLFSFLLISSLLLSSLLFSSLPPSPPPLSLWLKHAKVVFCYGFVSGLTISCTDVDADLSFLVKHLGAKPSPNLRLPLQKPWPSTESKPPESQEIGGKQEKTRKLQVFGLCLGPLSPLFGLFSPTLLFSFFCPLCMWPRVLRSCKEFSTSRRFMRENGTICPLGVSFPRLSSFLH